MQEQHIGNRTVPCAGSVVQRGLPVLVLRVDRRPVGAGQRRDKARVPAFGRPVERGAAALRVRPADVGGLRASSTWIVETGAP